MLTDALLPPGKRLETIARRRIFTDYDSQNRCYSIPGVRGAYVPIPKSASTTVQFFLSTRFGDNRDGQTEKVHRNTPSQPTLKAGRDHSLFYFSFVRNPWARLFSLYKSTFQTRAPNLLYEEGTSRLFVDFGKSFWTGMSFGEFVDAVVAIPDHRADNHFRSQWTFLQSPRLGLTVDFIGRVEFLQRDMSRVLRALGERPASLRHLNRATLSSREYLDAYTPELARKVSERYARDVAFFGYQLADAATH